MTKLMTYDEIIKLPEYKFLTDGSVPNLMLLSYAGSISYGTNTPDSDIDVRGVFCTLKELMGHTENGQYVSDDCDTTIYEFRKFCKLLSSCNPNTIELVGLNPEHYLYISPVGQQLLDNYDMFLSRRAVTSFGGYAGQQLNRLENALARDRLKQAKVEEHLKRSMYSAVMKFNGLSGADFKLEIDTSDRVDLDVELFCDLSLKSVSVRDLVELTSDLQNVLRTYKKFGKSRTMKDDKHLNKHAMHLVRLLLTGSELLETGKVNTYRGKDRDLLMSIRMGEYMAEDGIYKQEFYDDLVTPLMSRFEYAAENTSLPDEPDKHRIEDFIDSVAFDLLKEQCK